MPVKSRLHRKHLKFVFKRNNSQISTSSSEESIDPRYSNTKDGQNSSLKRQLRHYHFNACRTKIHLLLDKKAFGKQTSPQKRKRRVSFFLMSEEYKRKMSDALQEQDYATRRKVSWGDQSQFVAFNKNKSCQAIRQAPRHKFSIDE